MTTTHFYRDIKSLRLPVTDVLQERYFYNVPDDWSIIIADVQNSTAAVAAGKHNDVNLVAAGSLIAALNIAKEKNIEIPFFFSGDGGAVIVPGSVTNDVLTALEIHNDNSFRNLGLRMHIGSVTVGDIVAKGAILKIAKMQLGESLDKALVLGNGLKVAETQVKGASARAISPNPSQQILNMAGLECRWDKVKPPADESEIVCYLIEARRIIDQASVYRKVMLKIDELYGNLETRSPLSMNRLKLLLSLQKIEKEMLVKYGRWKIRYFFRTLMEDVLGIFYFRFDLGLGNVTGRKYLAQLIANADTLTIDGRINTIICGRSDKRKDFLNFLSTLETAGEIFFGHHSSKESVMTCYIENRNAKHIHFIDGSEGGYTEAAKALKQKFIKPV